MIILFTMLVFIPQNADQIVNITGYVTTAYVALRASYSVKAAVENYQKLKSQITSNNEEFLDGESEPLG